MTPGTINENCAVLFDTWCERRAIAPLRYLLRAWPLSGGLTDDWGELYTALRSISVDRETGLPKTESDRVLDMIRAISAIIHR